MVELDGVGTHSPRRLRQKMVRSMSHLELVQTLRGRTMLLARSWLLKTVIAPVEEEVEEGDWNNIWTHLARRVAFESGVHCDLAFDLTCTKK